MIIFYMAYCWLAALAINLIEIPLFLIGLFIVPIALLFRSGNPSETWSMITLPGWAFPWGNDWDGAMGDKQLRYWHRDAPKWPPFWKMWYWLAIRNYINNASRYWFSCDVSKHKPVLVAGQYRVRDKYDGAGWQLVRAGFKFGFYHVIPIDEKTGYVCRVGFKIDPKDADTDYTGREHDALMGCTFKPYLKQEL